MELRTFNQSEAGIFNPILATYQRMMNATFDTDRIAVDTAPDGSTFYHLLAIRSVSDKPTGSDLISVLLSLDVENDKPPGLAGVFLEGDGNTVEAISLKNKNGDVIDSSDVFHKIKYTTGPTFPPPPQPIPSAMISSPSVGNLSHDGPGRWSGTIDVSVGIFSWDVISWKYDHGKYSWEWID